MTSLTPVTSDTTATLVSIALNASMAKHMAIAQNIANVNNEGYLPLTVDFDRQVALYREQLLDRRGDASSARLLETLRSAATVTEAPDAAGKVQLDMEIARMAQNSVHYQALLSAHGKLSSYVRLAINGGR